MHWTHHDKADTDQVLARAHTHDAGFDLVAAVEMALFSGQQRIVPTNIAVAIPEGHVGLVCSRSGLAAKHGVFVMNAPGIIDAGYRGEVGVILWNSQPTPFQVHRGDRIAQLVVVPVYMGPAEYVERLPGSGDERGAGGFGSTGT